jgi:tetratricopeptide (TPR) repeat protein
VLGGVVAASDPTLRLLHWNAHGIQVRTLAVRRLALLLALVLACAAAGRAAEPAPSGEPEAGETEGQGPSVDALVARAQLCAVKQDWTQAEQVYHDALDKDPERADAWRGLGYVLRKQGNTAEARAAYEKALELAPADGETLLGLGETYVASGRTADAKPLLEKLREIDKRAAATLDWIIRTGKAR